VPAVRDENVLSGLLIAPPPGAAAAVLVDAQVSDRFRVPSEDPIPALAACRLAYSWPLRISRPV
jgi:hypothetical protein